jgi:hypothetical protein
MATSTIIVTGRYFDGCTEADMATIAKKINDVTTGATTYTISIAKKGRELVAVIVTT